VAENRGSPTFATQPPDSDIGCLRGKQVKAAKAVLDGCSFNYIISLPFEKTIGRAKLFYTDTRGCDSGCLRSFALLLLLLTPAVCSVVVCMCLTGIFTPQAEITNGRAAMLGFAVLAALEYKAGVPFF
jgi:hypothetical protein